MWNKWCMPCCELRSSKQSKKRSENILELPQGTGQEQEKLITPEERANDMSQVDSTARNTMNVNINSNSVAVQDKEEILTNEKISGGEASKNESKAGVKGDLNFQATAVSYATPISSSHTPRNLGLNAKLNQSKSHNTSGKYVWTLKDVLDSPLPESPKAKGDVDFLEKSQIEETQKLNSQEHAPTKPRVTKISEDVDTVYILPRRNLRGGSMYHHHATFFLPRISTDPTDVRNETMDNYDMNIKPFPTRRGSMIVRSGRTTANSSITNASEYSGSGSAVENFIVTPFAQVLVSMQRIRHAFICLTRAQSTHRFGAISSAIPEPSPADLIMPDNPQYKIVATETLDELEWCLKQLENIQTKRPVSDMAFSKFKRLLNKELNSFSETDKSRNDISAYICGTFLEDEKDAEADKEIELSLERRRSSGQSSGNQDQSAAAPGAKLPTSVHNVEVISTSSKNTADALTGRTDAPEGSGTSAVTAAKPLDESSTISATTLSDENKTPNGEQRGEMTPMHGIPTPNDKELDERFTQTLDTWGADIFEFDRLSNGHALTTTAYRIFKNRDLMNIFSIDPANFVRYILKVESTYHADVPYHNALHAADVLQTSHFLLQAEPLEDVFSDLEILAVLFASIIHDVDHPGLTNQFLINTGHDLALQYNDSSVLENHHLYVAFKLLNEKDCDFLASLNAKKRLALRRMVIELVLATDMSKHMSLLADLRTMVETKKVSGSGLLNLDNYADRIQILQNMMHCADLSNAAKPLRLNRKWTTRLQEEFFRQGDRERSLKIEISPMCDRETVAVEKSQVSFIDFVAHPLLESWCDLVHPSEQIILDTLADNRDWYESQAEGVKSARSRPTLPTAEENDEESAACN